MVETQKGAIEIEIFERGLIDKIFVQPGERVPVGAPLALARANGEAAPAPAPEPAVATAVPALPVPAPAPALAPTVPPLPRAPEGQRPRVTPAARKRAAELGLDPKAKPTTSPDGVVALADIELLALEVRAALTPAAAPPTRPRGFDPAAMRQAIAAAIARSKREIPHYYLHTTIDMAPALAWLEGANRDRPVTGRLLHAVLLLKAVPLALCKAPALNGFWKNGGRFEPAPASHVGWAISLRGGGLVAPAVHDADAKSLDELMVELPWRAVPRRRRPPFAGAGAAMTTDQELKQTVFDTLRQIAPDAEPSSVAPDADLREELDLDSIDFLNFAIALHERLGVDIPEADYPKLAPLDGAVAYLSARTAAATA